LKWAGPVSELGPAPVYRPSTGGWGMGGRYPYNALRIDWFLSSLFGNREDVVEAELSLVEVSVFTQSCFDSISG
jgi:hypothetical protein